MELYHVLGLCALALCIVNQVEPARRVDVEQRVREMRQVLTKRSGTEPTKLEELLNLTQGEGVEYEASISLPHGVKKKRFTETFRGVPVFDTLVTSDNTQDDVTGSIIQDIDEDLWSIKPKYSEDWAIKRVIHLEGDDLRQLDFTHKKAKLWIYVDETKTARLAYLLDYFAESKTEQSRPMYFLDAMTGETILKWQGLDTQTISGRGGNKKTGRYTFGSKGYKKLQISRKGSQCIMENKHVRVVNLDYQTVEHTNPLVLRNCKVGSRDAINGGFSPANDAMYYGTGVWNMYKNWYGVNTLKSKIILRVHFGKKYENAFWNGDEVTFGDGGKKYYPLVSLDVTAHEISHGFTEQNSGLLYFGESGGINEAFSDMSGKSLEHFLKGNNFKFDWKFGYDATKSRKPMRYMEDPARDGKSIEHALQFHNGLDVHQTSGVFNRAFTLLSNLRGWDIRRAFRVFVTANVLYWTPRSDFNDAACGLSKAAKDCGYSESDVKKVLALVGVFCKPKKGYGIKQLKNNKPVVNLAGSQDSLQFFVIQKESDKGDLRIGTSGGRGDCELYVKYGKPPTTTQYDRVSKRKGNKETIIVKSAQSGIYFIMIKGRKWYKKVKLLAFYQKGSGTTRQCKGPELCNGIPVTGLSAKPGQMLRFSFKVPRQCSVTIETNSGNGDADLYVRYGSKPTVHLWDYRPFIWGNIEKVEDPGSAKDGIFYIMLSGYEKFSGLTLKGSYSCSTITTRTASSGT